MNDPIDWNAMLNKCTAKNTIIPMIKPTYGTILVNNCANKLAVIAIPPVDRHNANNLEYDNTSPKNPNMSITPIGPVPYINNANATTAIAPTTYMFPNSKYAITATSTKTQHSCPPHNSLV